MALKIKMAEQYYISTESFFHNANLREAWYFMIGLIGTRNNTEIKVVEWIDGNELELNSALLEKSHFDHLPRSVNVSKKPYLTKDEHLYICYNYKLSAHVLKTMEIEWLAELQETLVTHNFVIKSRGKDIFWMNDNGIGALLYPAEMQAFKELGVDFKPWDVTLNDTI